MLEEGFKWKNQTFENIIVTERTCQNWVKQFNNGNFDFEDKKTMGRRSVEIEDDLKTYLVGNPRASSLEIVKACLVAFGKYRAESFLQMGAT